MRKPLIPLLLSLSVAFAIPLTSFAQAPSVVWSHTYHPNSAALSLYEMPDSGFVLGGYVVPDGQPYRDMYIVRTDVDGDTLWTNAIGLSDRGESAASLYPTTDGGFVLTGVRAQDDPYSFYADVYLVKTNAAGDAVWASAFGAEDDSESGVCAVPAPLGGYMVVGGLWDEWTGWDLWLVTTDNAGNRLTSNHLDWPDADYPVNMCVTADGGFAVTGKSQSFDDNYDYDIFLLKLNGAGAESWTQFYGSDHPWDESANHICQTSDGGYLMCGYRQEPGSDKDIYVVKTNASGGVDWTSEIGGTYHDEARCCIETDDGGYAVSASWYRNGNWQTALIKYNIDGDTVWTSCWGDPANGHTPYGLVQTADGGYAVGGLMSSTPAVAYLIKFAPEQNLDPFTFHDAFLELPFNDATPAADTLLINDANLIGRNLLGLKVILDTIYHSAIEELSVTLSHDGVDMVLVGEGDATGENFEGTIFSDAALSPLFGGQAPYTGRYQPLENLNAFAGTNPQGYWILRVNDNVPGNDGTIKGWGLTLITDVVTDVETPSEHAPVPGYELSQCYPNPFNPTTTIRYTVPTRSEVVIEVFNTLGQRVTTLVHDSKPAGEYFVTWDGRNADGMAVSAGVYLYRLRAGDLCESKKMVLLK